ncbi:MAG: hypothetical protein E8D45_10005 [Nitrospira sp.]|mgnify:CR=1 FL=1|nr:MAG: hypothetical protein E8D45_10005 [Nitrospira sp.]
MDSRVLRHSMKGVAGLMVWITIAFVAPRADAACGAVQCFVVIGSQQQVSQQGLLAVNLFYNYTPMRLLDDTNGVIPAINQRERRLILDHHQEAKTITQNVTLDLNYGVTDRFGIEVMVPYFSRRHSHLDELGEANGGAGENVDFGDNGLGDIRLIAKYNVLSTLRGTLVPGFGVELPTGKSRSLDAANGVMEAPTQLGRGQAGLIGSLYQTYQVIPQRVSQFALASYRHTFRNNDGYQFGDEYLLNAGVNVVTVPWLTLTGQINYRYTTHDNISASLERSLSPADPGFPDDPIVLDSTILSRRVPNTGHTYLAFTPGFQISAGAATSFYFYSSIPMARDSNNNLAQGVSYVFGLTQYVDTSKLFGSKTAAN